MLCLLLLKKKDCLLMSLKPVSYTHLCKRENMPKDNIERAIKNALGKDQSDYKSMTYEGYGCLLYTSCRKRPPQSNRKMINRKNRNNPNGRTEKKYP